MANLPWKNNPIDKLECNSNPLEEPTFADYETWKDSVFRSTQSVGIPYVKKLISDLKWDGGDPPILVAGASAPEKYDAVDCKEFQQAVIRLAVIAGRRFPQPNPTADLFYPVNFDNIISEISSFGQQIQRTGKRWHSDAFTQSELADWPLRPLLEWKTIESIYNPTKASGDAATYWACLNTALAQSVSLDSAFLRQWMKDIATPRNELIRLQPAATVDSSIISRVLTPLIQSDDTQPNHKLWSLQALKWEETYQEDPSKLGWPALKAKITNLVSKCDKDEHSTPNPRLVQRPRLAPHASTVPRAQVPAANGGR